MNNLGAKSINTFPRAPLCFGIGLGLVALLLREFFFVVTVEGSSMSPTLTQGDHLLVLRFWPPNWLRRGQIIVTDYVATQWFIEGSAEVFSDTRFIKRIRGLPGDVIETAAHYCPQFSLGKEVIIGGQLPRRRCQIPPGHYFVEGDSMGLDSNTVGPIPFDALRGVVITKLKTRADSRFSVPAHRTKAETDALS